MKDKNKMLNKSMKFGLALLLIAILAIGATVAFFTDIEAAVNSISTGKVEVEVEENVSGLTKSSIGVKATGTSECYVRIRVDIPTLTYTYKDDDGKEQVGSAVVTYLLKMVRMFRTRRKVLQNGIKPGKKYMCLIYIIMVRLLRHGFIKEMDIGIFQLP